MVSHIRHHQPRGRHDRNDLACRGGTPRRTDARVAGPDSRCSRAQRDRRGRPAGHAPRGRRARRRSGCGSPAACGPMKLPIGRIAEAQRHVEAVRDEIADVVAHDQFEPEVAVLGQEPGQFAREHEAREEGIDVDAQPSRARAGRAGRVQSGLLDPVEMRPTRSQKRAALVAQPQRCGWCGRAAAPRPAPPTARSPGRRPTSVRPSVPAARDIEPASTTAISTVTPASSARHKPFPVISRSGML